MPISKKIFSEITHVVLLVLLLFILLFILTWTNIIPCKNIPGWCPIFYSLKGAPSIVIVYGSSGLGDPDALLSLLNNRDVIPRRFGGLINKMQLSLISPQALKKYDVVIVTRAKKIRTEQLKILRDYVLKNPRQGRLIWTGDAGTELGPRDEIYKEVRREFSKFDLNYVLVEEKNPSPLSRKTQDGEIVAFDKDVLGVKFVYSEDYESPKSIGTYKTVIKNSYTRGIREGLNIYSTGFAVNKPYTYASKIAVLKAVPKINKEKFDEDVVPLITSNLNGKVIYYAIPPELIENEEGKTISVFILNLYEGVLGI